MKHNPVGWFEIPTVDFERAIGFYEALFDVKLERMETPALPMAMFPHDDGPGAGGALVHNLEWYKPTLNGPLIYFTTPSGDLEVDSKRVEELGGKIWVPKKHIGDYGWIVVFEDTEGNRIALHSRE